MDGYMQKQYSELERLSDEELCQALQSGNADAEEILVHRYSRMVRSCTHPYFLAGGDSEDLLIDREKAAALLNRVRSQLSDLEIRVLDLYLDGCSCGEIAATVGKPYKSVDNAVQRIRRKVARQISSGDISNG